VDHVRLGKDSAAPGNARRRRRLQCQRRELVLDADAQPLRLLVEEGTRAGSAERVHAEIDQHRLAGMWIVVQDQQLTVLAPDLDHRARVGMIFAHRARLCYQFVDVRQASLLGDGPAAGTGEPGGHDLAQIDAR
jgi:hypothetical protein